MAGLVETARHPRTAASAVQMAVAVAVDTFLDVAVAVHNLWLPSQVVAAAEVAESERPGSQSLLEQKVPPVVAAVAAHNLA